LRTPLTAAAAMAVLLLGVLAYAGALTAEGGTGGAQILVDLQWEYDVGAAVYDVYWAPNGRIYYGSYNGFVGYVDAEAGVHVKVEVSWGSKPSRQSVTGISWREAGGGLLAFGAWSRFNLYESNAAAFVEVVDGDLNRVDFVSLARDVDVVSVAWSPDGGYLAVGLRGPDVWEGEVSILRWGPQGFEGVVASLEVDGAPFRLAWSPDGRYLAVGTRIGGDSGVLYIAEFDGEELDVATALAAHAIGGVAWSPEGGRLAVATWSDPPPERGDPLHTLTIYQFTGESLRFELAALIEGSATDAEWSPDGGYIAVTSRLGDGGGIIYLFTEGGELAAQAEVDGAVPMTLSWSPQGDGVAVGSRLGLEDGSIMVYRLREAQAADTTVTGGGGDAGAPVDSVDSTATAEFTATGAAAVEEVGLAGFIAAVPGTLIAAGAIVGFLVLVGGIVVLESLLERRSRRGGGGESSGVAVERGSQAGGGSGGLESVEALLGRPLQGFKAGAVECRGDFRVQLGPAVAPRGYEGEWRCCRLGCGGWGCAYRCVRPEGGEPVVFKVPLGLEGMIEEGVVPTVPQRLVERVAWEAETVSRLRHPHLLRLLAYSRSAPLLVYEYADQGSLERQLALGWRPRVRDTLLLGVQLGDALRYIHSRGLVHGDVKPGNVFVRGGVVKLGDFSGLVRLVSMTSRHPLSYTPGWRAPEQVYLDLRRRAVERGLENRIDVYQLGNLLLYLLTGESMDGEEAANPERLKEALARVPGDDRLKRLLGEMLAPEPWRRPSMDEVVRRLLEAYNSLSEGS